MDIEIIRQRVAFTDVRRLAGCSFGDMVKGVVDIQRGIIALGGQLHADAEALLLEDGSCQQDLWGFNIYVEKPAAERLEFSSLINIRPAVGARSMDIQDTQIRTRMAQVIEGLIQ